MRCSRDVHVEVESHGQSKHMTSFPVKCKHITLSFPYKVMVNYQRSKVGFGPEPLPTHLLLFLWLLVQFFFTAPLYESEARR